MKINLISIILGIFISTNILSAQITTYDPYINVDDVTYTNVELVKDVLIEGVPCAIIENVHTASGYEVGEYDGIAYFSNESPFLDMEDGIILATGGVLPTGPHTGAAGPSNFLHLPGGSFPSDQQLTDYLNNNANIPPSPYFDASVLEFDFTSTVDSISFNFIFASNEYGFFQCDFSDSFAFFLEDSEGNVTNMAILKDEQGNIIPGVNGEEIPISVVTIRDNAHNENCSSENEQLFDVFWDFGNLQAPINFFGQTKKMQAWSHITPGETYHLKMVIQDRGDNFLDSAIFIEGGSFYLGPLADLGNDITIDSEAAVCKPNEVILSTPEQPGSCFYFWYLNGEPIPGADTNTYTATETGIYTVEIACTSAACVVSDEKLVEFKTSPVIPDNWQEERVVCGDFQAFDISIIPDNLPELTNLDYTWYKDDVRLDSETTNAITISGPGKYTIVVEEYGCEVTEEVIVYNPNFTVDLGQDIEVCDSNGGMLEPIIDGVNISDPTLFSYLWNTGETTKNINVTESGTYTIEVTYRGCTITESINVFFYDIPNVNLGKDFQICAGSTSIISASIPDAQGKQFKYEWYKDDRLLEEERGRTIEISEVGTYTVNAFEVGSTHCPGVDNVNVSYYDNKNCLIPKGISPETSIGINDCLDLLFLNDRSGIEKISLFNRHGRLVFEKKDYTNTWCGQDINGNTLPTGTYYYVVSTKKEDPVLGKLIKGWVYINRAAN